MSNSSNRNGRSFYIEEKGYADQILLKAEHEKLVERLSQLQSERATWMTEITKRDTKMARTLELESILESQGSLIIDFSEDLYQSIIEKIIVKERTRLEFHLKNGLRFEEHYTLKRGRDLF